MTAVFQRPPTAQEAVLTQVPNLIATGRMRPGEQIVQEALALQLGVSRVPLREALKLLEDEGQVTYEAHRGYFVALLSLADLLEVYRMEILEADAGVSIAIPLMTAEDMTGSRRPRSTSSRPPQPRTSPRWPRRTGGSMPR